MARTDTPQPDLRAVMRDWFQLQYQGKLEEAFDRYASPDWTFVVSSLNPAGSSTKTRTTWPRRGSES
jgi:hypothetical protein